jgi:ABC-type sugar transport system substrate-binding protein
MLTVKQSLMAATAAFAAMEGMSVIEAKDTQRDVVKMFFSNNSDKNRHFNKLRKARAKKKAAKLARKKNRRK